MAFRFSAAGEHFTRPSGALELMDDLGQAMAGECEALLLGGGNPGSIPAMRQVFMRRLAEIAASPAEFDRFAASYAHPAGEIAFRRALASLLRREYGWPVTAANVALTAGSQAAFFLLFNLFAGRDAAGNVRRLLLPVTPEYVGYADVALEHGLLAARRPVIEELPDELFKYRVDFGALEIGDDVAAVCVSRPTNPTGNVITNAELAELARRTAAANVPLILDSAYGLPFPSIVFADADPFWDEGVVLCMSLSKLGLPGVRTGIVVASEQVIEALTSMTAVLNLAVGSVGPVLATPLVESGELLELCRRHVQPFYRDKADRAREWLARALAGVPYRIHKPEGAFFLWLWLPGLPISSAELYARLKARGVFVLSGHYFFPGLEEPWAHRNECIRVSFAQDDDVVRRGVELVAAEVRRAFGA